MVKNDSSWAILPKNVKALLSCAVIVSSTHFGSERLIEPQ